MSQEQAPSIWVTYSRDADALYLYLVHEGDLQRETALNRSVARSVNFTEDVVLDFDERDILVGIEIIDFLSSVPDITGLVPKYGIDPHLPKLVESVRRHFSETPVRQAKEELVLA